MFFRYHLSLALLLFSYAALQAQDTVLPLGSNPVIQHHLQTTEKQSPAAAKKKRNATQLPFFDDFSGTKIYPDKALWTDRSVYVNNGFAVDPPSYGVATFDGLNQYGFPYNTEGAKQSRPCDTLTSVEIDLEGVNEDDSLYLSFYLQEKGIGELPDPEDRFLVEYKNEEGTWINGLSVKAISKKSLVEPTFKQYMLRISAEQAALYHKAFQFRFRVQGNKTGALDHWHLDYVYLDTNRTRSQPHIGDVCFYKAPLGLLKHYRSMPYRHFRQNPKVYTQDTVHFHVKNHDAQAHDPDIHYETYALPFGKKIDSSDLRAKSIFGLKPQTAVSGPQVNELQSSAFSNFQHQDIKLQLKLILKTHKVIESPSTLTKQNDTLVMQQSFADYFAYDDGGAEMAYGLQFVDEGAVALEYRVEVPETLQYVAFHFTSARFPLAVDKKFDIMVWDQLEDQDRGNAIARIRGVKPVYSNTMNGYVLYKLDKPLVIKGRFYIGWHQFSKFHMNVGMDMDYRHFNNSEPNPHLWVHYQGLWEPSTAIGAPMIRPVFGNNVQLSRAEAPETNELEVRVFPNPCSHQVRIATAGSFNASLYNMQGQLQVQRTDLIDQTELDLSHLPSGMYLLRVEIESGQVANERLIKQ